VCVKHEHRLMHRVDLTKGAWTGLQFRLYLSLRKAVVTFIQEMSKDSAETDLYQATLKKTINVYRCYDCERNLSREGL
jgi:hypothetical protein